MIPLYFGPIAFIWLPVFLVLTIVIIISIYRSFKNKKIEKGYFWLWSFTVLFLITPQLFPKTVNLLVVIGYITFLPFFILIYGLYQIKRYEKK